MSRRLVLGFDTATPVTTVALVEAVVDTEGTAGGVWRSPASAEASHRDPRRHGEVLPTLIADVLQAAGRRIDEVTDVAVGIGPGAYTGLRVGVATAEALGLALGVPVHGVATVDAIAYETGLQRPLVVVTDARRREVYVARYADHLTRQGDPLVVRPEDVTSEVVVVGTVDTPPLVDVDIDRVDGPTGSGVCKVAIEGLVGGGRLDPVRPMYLRRPDVSAPTGTKSVLS